MKGKRMNIRIRRLAWMAGVMAGVMAAGADDVQVEFKDPSQWIWTGAGYGPSAAVKTSEDTSPSGGKSLMFKYDLRGEEGKDSYCAYEYQDKLVFDRMPKSVGIWVKGDKHLHPLRIQFVDNNNTVHQWILGVISWDGWRKVEVPLKFAVVGYDQWGPSIPETGAATKSGFLDVEPPVRFHALVVGSQSTGEKDAGAVKLSDLEFKN